MNDPVSRFRRLAEYYRAYRGNSQAERRARRFAALNAWAAIPNARDRAKLKGICP